jgi:putative restriction endonuclease
MPRVSKKTLMQGVVEVITNSGWQVDRLSAPAEHPLRLRLSRGGKTLTTRIYIWSLTHGGGAARPGHEYRIQVTSGVSRFEIESGEKTIVLGWSAQFGVFAGFDVTRHTGPMGSSPSMQISKTALLRAGDVGVAAHTRRREEIAIAVRPDLLPGYVERLELMHHKASVDQQIEELRRDRQPPEDADAEAEAEAARVTTRMEKGQSPHFGDVNEVKQRRTILDRLEALEKHVGIGIQEPAKIGHNHPPEPIDSEAAPATRSAIMDAAHAISDEVAKPLPGVAKVATQTTVLAKIARGLRAAQNEAIEFGKKTKQKVVDIVAGAAAMTIVGGVAAHPHIGGALSAALDSIATWFKMLF